MNLEIIHLREDMDRYLFAKNMSKNIAKNVSKNLSAKYSQKNLLIMLQMPSKLI